MLNLNTHKYAIKCNKNKYMKSLCIPFIACCIFLLFSFIPHLASLIFEQTELHIPKTYTIYNSILKCILITAIGFMAYLFYATFSLGEEAWYSGRLTFKKNCFKRFIYWFKPTKAFKALSLKSILMCLRIFWTFVFLIPATVTATTIFLTAFNGGIEIHLFLSLSAGTLALLICGIIFRFVFIQRYFLSEFILAQNPNNGVIQSIKKSKNLMDGQIFRVILFKIGFVPLFLSCIMIIPIFFVYPHYKQSRSIIANALMI